MLDSGKMPLYMRLSVLAAAAIGMIIYRFSDDLVLSVLVAIFLVIADYVTLSWWIGKNK